jgi:hypothetical protein
MRYPKVVFSVILLAVCVLMWLRNRIGRKAPRVGDTYCRLQKNAMRGVPTDTVLSVFRGPLQSAGLRYHPDPTLSTFLFFNMLSEYGDLHEHVWKLPHCRYVYSLLAIDLLASKSAMYKHLKRSLSTDALESVVPPTTVIDANTASTFDTRPNTLYILKKNLQRQEGCLLTEKASDVRDAHRQNYVVCQEVLKDNYLVAQRKINIRQYVVVTVTDEPSFHLYADGFVYYAPEPYDEGSNRPEVHITSGFNDRSVYLENPLTLKDLYVRLGAEKATTLRKNIHSTLRTVMQSYRSILRTLDGKNDLQKNFALLGIDLSVSRALTCKVMEINKGPSLDPKDPRDAALKRDVVAQTVALLLDPETARRMRSLD